MQPALNPMHAYVTSHPNVSITSRHCCGSPEKQIKVFLPPRQLIHSATPQPQWRRRRFDHLARFSTPEVCIDMDIPPIALHVGLWPLRLVDLGGSISFGMGPL